MTWRRGEEHETRIRFHYGKNVTLTLECIMGSEPEFKEAERDIVNALKIFPHPDAPRNKYEYDYPTYREACYKSLQGDQQCERS